MTTLIIGNLGEIALPDDVRQRHGFLPSSQIRVIETRGGVLLIPLGDAPVSEELARELEEWRALGAATWESFPYADSDA